MAVAAVKSAPAKDDKASKRKVMTPEFRVSFPQVFKAKAFDAGEAKYSLTMLFPAATDLKQMKQAAFHAAVEKFGPKEKWPKNLRLPFRDGNDKEDLQGYKDHIFVSASSKQRPGVINQKLEHLSEDDNQFYAGCYARATLIAFAYDTKGNKGVSFALQNVQKLRDGEPFSGRKKAEDEFEAVDTVDDDDMGTSSSGDGGDELGLD